MLTFLLRLGVLAGVASSGSSLTTLFLRRPLPGAPSAVSCDAAAAADASFLLPLGPGLLLACSCSRSC